MAVVAKFSRTHCSAPPTSIPGYTTEHTKFSGDVTIVLHASYLHEGDVAGLHDFVQVMLAQV